MVKTLKNITVFFLTGVFLLSSGFGCKGLSQQQQAAVRPVTLEYWTVYDDVDALQSLVNKYKATHPFINVQIRQLRSDEFYNRLVEALAEDKGPDIVSISNRTLRSYLSKLSPMPSSVSDTTMVVKKGAVNTQTVVNTYTVTMPSTLQIEREYVQAVKQDAIIDGKIYGLPLSLDTMGIFYNKDLLDRSGVAEPPKDWSEFSDAVKKITKYERNGGKILQSGTALGTGNNVTGVDDLLFILFRQSNIDFTSRTGQPAFQASSQNNNGETTPAMNVMNFYTDFADSTRDTYSWNESLDDALTSFVRGSVGFYFGYSYDYPTIKARAPQMNLGVMSMLQLNPDKPINAASYWVQAVTEKSQHKNEAWGLINYLTHSKLTQDYLDQTGRPTALRTFISAQKEKPELQPFVSQVLVAENWYKGRSYDVAVKALKDMVHEWLQPAPDEDRILEYKQGILNKAATKIKQTL